jgi:hypothetical protein
MPEFMNVHRGWSTHLEGLMEAHEAGLVIQDEEAVDLQACLGGPEVRHGLLPVRGTQRRGRAAQPAIPTTRSMRFQSGVALAHHLTPCLPCSSGLLHPRSRAGAQPNDRLKVTVIDRLIPLVPAPYGTRMARPVRAMKIRT